MAWFTPDGLPDPAFGGGIVTTDVSESGDAPHGVAIDGAGRIVVAGVEGASFVDSDFMALRYTPDGALDADFGNDGIVTTNLDGADDSADGAARAVAVDAVGRIVVMGERWDDIIVARDRADGALDPAFAEGGLARTGVRIGAPMGRRRRRRTWRRGRRRGRLALLEVPRQHPGRGELRTGNPTSPTVSTAGSTNNRRAAHTVIARRPATRCRWMGCGAA